MAAVGTARIAPTIPEQRAADEQRDDHDDRADADLTRHHLGHEHVILELLLDEEEQRHAERRAPGDTDSATATAGIAASSGPTTGIISPMPAISAST